MCERGKNNGKAIKVHQFINSTWTWKSMLTLIQTEPLEEAAIDSG
jgi:hypothetical protein